MGFEPIRAFARRFSRSIRAIPLHPKYSSKTLEGVRPAFLPGRVADVLRDHMNEGQLFRTDPLFAIPRRTVQEEHRRACDLVGIAAYTIHDHRYTAAVHLARCGMPLHLLQQQLGHENIEMTMRYARS